MPKTEVILTHNIVGLGAESDQVKVAAGYARNYLYPQGLAVPVSSTNKRRLEALRQRRAEREAHEYNSMSELAKSISKLTAHIKVKTGEDGKMFGSVTAGAIADELKHQFEITLDKKKIHLEHPLRTLGEHQIELRLHPEVTSSLKVRIESTTPLAVPAEAPGRQGREGRDGGYSPRTEKRGRRGAEETTPAAPVEAKAEKPAKGAKAEKSEKGGKAGKSEKGK
ncbi:MAG TPA: 50S ribosomal protein L9 [Candidatus Saccharimonadales bacterium]|nr:50S ribosomal protein L9 [Candidatus Saccharimonadales bacterium]